MSELREEVPSDAGYEVDRFAEKPDSALTKPGEMDSPEVVARSIKNLQGLKFRPPKSSPVLGETVMTDEEIAFILKEYKKAYPHHTPVTCDNSFMQFIAKYARRKVAEALMRLSGYHQGDNGIVLDRKQFNALVADLEG